MMAVTQRQGAGENLCRPFGAPVQIFTVTQGSTSFHPGLSNRRPWRGWVVVVPDISLELPHYFPNRHGR